MLVLTRHINETIMIGDNIEITVVSVKGEKVRIGIAAPHNVPVHRKEIYLAIKQSNIEAANADVDMVEKLPELERLLLKSEKKEKFVD